MSTFFVPHLYTYTVVDIRPTIARRVVATISLLADHCKCRHGGTFLYLLGGVPVAFNAILKYFKPEVRVKKHVFPLIECHHE